MHTHGRTPAPTHTHLFKMVTSEETEFEVMARAFLNIHGYFTLSERESVEFKKTKLKQNINRT